MNDIDHNIKRIKIPWEKWGNEDHYGYYCFDCTNCNYQSAIKSFNDNSEYAFYTIADKEREHDISAVIECPMLIL